MPLRAPTRPTRRRRAGPPASPARRLHALAGHQRAVPAAARPRASPCCASTSGASRARRARTATGVDERLDVVAGLDASRARHAGATARARRLVVRRRRVADRRRRAARRLVPDRAAAAASCRRRVVARRRTIPRPKRLAVPEHDQFRPPDAAREVTADWVEHHRRGRRRAPTTSSSAARPRSPTAARAPSSAELSRTDASGRRADDDAGGGHDGLGLADGVLAEVEDRRGQHRVGAALDDARRPGARACRRRRWRSPGRRRRRRPPG